MSNRLASETSPYLLQHKDNPVDWYPWGDEAFATAAERDVPVLLSVGYSTCHWCHVMERESFEDPQTAELMNRLFVPVKVDREERPDVDAIYMEAVQAMTGRGGWPMTVFLTPDRAPFFAGTYFPNQDRHGMPSFQRVLGAIHEAWTERRDEVTGRASGIAESIGGTLAAHDSVPDLAAVQEAYRAVADQFDPINGGFGGAPKFPQEPVLEFLLRAAAAGWAPDALDLATTTLQRMADGGIYDHIGGGFSRYAVDNVWLVPHFEKMLYNNAELARIFLHGWQLTGNDQFRTVATETLDYLIRDMTHPDGGIFAAEDADSEGVEGKFYAFTLAELSDVVSSDDVAVVAAAFGVSHGGNFEGSNVIHRPIAVDDLAARFSRSPQEIEAAISRARMALRDTRNGRIRPGLDDKVVAEWNGLALRAFALAGAVLDQPHYLDVARRIGRFANDHLRNDRGDVIRTWAKGGGSGPGFLADHAALAIGFYTLFGVTGESEWYQHADQLTRRLAERFSGELGVVYATEANTSDLITRPVDQQDNPTASGASLAAEALLMRHLYTGEPEPLDEFERIAKAAGLLIERAPLAAGHLLGLLTSYHQGMREVAITGPDAKTLAGVLWNGYRPQVVVALDPNGAIGGDVPLLEGRFRAGETLAYVCERMVCAAPVGTPEALAELL